MIEFFEDLIEHDPLEAYPASVAQSGAFVRSTGDPVADKWEREIAEGKVPDFTAAFDAEDLAQLKRTILKKKNAASEDEMPEGFSIRGDA